ncbi:MAG: VOC family protein [Anaerolineaceae bacterium]|nr:VOC family protein [Anaerolineaceae bacterium]
MPKITPFLWFEQDAEEAINFYTSIFEDGEIVFITRYGDGQQMPAGTLNMAMMHIAGQDFMILNGGPYEKFTPAMSIFVSCDTQEEIDRYWDQLSQGGEIMQCGWLTDRYGLTWQIVPYRLGALLNDGDPVKAQRVLEAMLQMKKLDLPALLAAYEGSG